ncbi:hypothetical protein GNQ08_02330 [Paenibacillus macerans]|uniref:Uncharacterized protein n=1 Tax=Paenibacillus macerans TaxID=44252 RepID=A0A6N8ER93_PAEMA|nr:hypothetical protein [Paenibacillus macerans]MUG21270.1 hypothetical protein [Paenibacillus macerans]
MKNIRAKSVPISAISPILSAIEVIYVAIFQILEEMPVSQTIHRKIRTKNAANEDEHAWLRIISTLSAAILNGSAALLTVGCSSSRQLAIPARRRFVVPTAGCQFRFPG